jgi:uncharacterized repeat protein (TIGR01451 family)
MSRFVGAGCLLVVVLGLASLGGAMQGRAADPSDTIAVTLTGSPTPNQASVVDVTAGGAAAFTIHVRNNGPFAVTNVAISSPAAPGSTFGATFASQSSSFASGPGLVGGTCQQTSSGGAFCTLERQLQKGESASVTLVFKGFVGPASGNWTARVQLDEHNTDNPNSTHTDSFDRSLALNVNARDGRTVSTFAPADETTPVTTDRNGDGLGAAAPGDVARTTFVVAPGSVGVGAVISERARTTAGDGCFGNRDCLKNSWPLAELSVVSIPGTFVPPAQYAQFNIRADASTVPPGMSPSKAKLFHDGKLVELITAPGADCFDGCLSGPPTVASDGDYIFTGQTGENGIWQP